jgi:hypothetical protein
MKTFEKRAEGLRLQRIKSSARWAGAGLRDVHPVPPGLRDTSAPSMPWPVN